MLKMTTKVGGRQPLRLKTIYQLVKSVLKRIATVREVANTFDMSYGSAQEIPTSEQGMTHVCARWISASHSRAHGLRVIISSEILKRFKLKGSNFTDRIGTCNETCVHFHGPESKQQSSVCKHIFTISR